jgi:deoxyribonucleoside regulator
VHTCSNERFGQGFSKHEMSDYLKSKISRMYYLSDISKTEIGHHLGISRFRVSRLLEQAREEGIVQIQINEPIATNTEIEEKLEKRFNLHLAIVVNSGDSTDRGIRRAVGLATADYLKNLLRDGDVFGITWGATVDEVIRSLPSKIDRRIQVVQITGGLNQTAIDINPLDIVHRVAEIYGATPYVLFAPAIVGNPTTRDAMVQDSSFQATIEMFSRVNIAISGIGAFSSSSDSYLQKAGYVTDEDINNLLSCGAVGDVFGHYFNIEGYPCSSELEERTIGMNLNDLQKVRYTIGVAGGIHKTLAILGTLRGSLINTLVTDLATANDILEKDLIIPK